MLAALTHLVQVLNLTVWLLYSRSGVTLRVYATAVSKRANKLCVYATAVSSRANKLCVYATAVSNRANKLCVWTRAVSSRAIFFPLEGG